MVSKSEAIQNFLLMSETPADLAQLYNEQMEVQVIVAADDHAIVRGEYKGRKWLGYQDDQGNIFKPFRIPWGANTSTPHYTNSPLNWDLAKHAEAIGMTGWNWVNQESMWVAYDFDSLVNHTTGLTEEKLQYILQLVSTLPYVTVRRSTSGSGYHLYVFLDGVKTETHAEHAALARAIMGKMCADAGYDFQADVDVMGGIMWCWARKMKGTNGLELVKNGDILIDIPINWKDHLDVVTKKKRKISPKVSESIDEFEKLISQRQVTPLDEVHSALINHLQKLDAYAEWDQDHNLLVTHTAALKQAHKDLDLKGIFKTTSTGKDYKDKNCFCFPLPNGAWSVRRFTPGQQEETTWDQDSAGWTRCYYNREPDLLLAVRYNGGLEDTDGSYVFDSAEQALTAAQIVNISFNLPDEYLRRNARLFKQKGSGRLVMQVERREDQDPKILEGWINKKKFWQVVGSVPTQPVSEPEHTTAGECFRHCIDAENSDAGWYILGPDGWQMEPLNHVKYVMSSYGYNATVQAFEIGQLIQNSWKLVNQPFRSEYPGGRLWNHQAAQLAFKVKDNTEDLKYPTWMKILNHCGKGLDHAVLKNAWCVKNGITSGGSYLKCWIAALFQEPLEPLPYLFLYGSEETGKTTLHEAIQLLMTRGVIRADTALMSSGAYNGELKNAVLGVVEETDLSGSKSVANNRMKDWVTSNEISIHIKGKTPYMCTNSLHFIQTANDVKYCPVFTGDTRITMFRVDRPETPVSRKELFDGLRKEARDFLTEIINLDLPPAVDRLRIPIVITDEKAAIGESNSNDFILFIHEYAKYVPGKKTSIMKLWDVFNDQLDESAQTFWTKRRMIKEMAAFTDKWPKGRSRKDNAYYFGNLSLLETDEPEDFQYVTDGDYLNEQPLE